MSTIDPSCLYAVLMNTGLQQKNNPLYQVMHSLIGNLSTINSQVNNVISGTTSSSSSSSGTPGIQGKQGISGIDGLDGDDSIFIPNTSSFSSSVVDDNATNATMYPVWVSATPGNEALKTSSTKLVWNPSIPMFSIGGSIVAIGSVTANPIIASVPNVILTTADGVVAQNPTLSTALVQVQDAPAIRLRGNIWNTTSVANNTSDFYIKNHGISGGIPSGFLFFQTSINGGALVTAAILDSPGNLTLSGTIGLSIANAAGITFGSRGYLSGGGADGQFLFRVNNKTAGVGLDVTTDALLKVRTRALTDDASLSALNITTSGTLFDKSYNIATPATLATVTMAANQQRQIINPAGTIAVLTVTLPSSPTDGQIAGISFTQIVSALTVNAPAGATVVQAPTSAAVDTNFRFIYQASSTSWFPAA